MERVLFFPDTGAEHPVWDADGHLLDPENLPLSTELWADLEAWADEAQWPDNYYGKPAELARLKAVGRVLCERVQDELGAEYEVVWRWDYK